MQVWKADFKTNMMMIYNVISKVLDTTFWLDRKKITFR